MSISLGVVHLCYALIHWIPDNVLRWINAASSALHSAENTGNQIGHDFKHSAGQGVNALQSSGVDSQRKAEEREEAEKQRMQNERANQTQSTSASKYSMEQAMRSYQQSSENYRNEHRPDTRNQSNSYVRFWRLRFR